MDFDDLSPGLRVKEVCRLIRLARSYWDTHNNLACRTAREQALDRYNRLDSSEKAAVPAVLKTWLVHRSEKYFGDHRTAPGGGGGSVPPKGTGVAGKRGGTDKARLRAEAGQPGRRARARAKAAAEAAGGGADDRAIDRRGRVVAPADGNAPAANERRRRPKVRCRFQNRQHQGEAASDNNTED